MGRGGEPLRGSLRYNDSCRSINERAHGLHDIGMNFRIPTLIPMQGLSSDKFHHNLQIIIRTIIR